MAVAAGHRDKGLNQFVMRGITAALAGFTRGAVPSGPFGLLFFVQTLGALCEQRANLIRVLSGEDLRWWPNE